MQLRYYQKEAVEQALLHNNGYINSCTASGKSVIIAEICKHLTEPTLILQPSEEIFVQNYEKIKNVFGNDVELGVYSASVSKTKTIKHITLATIGSIKEANYDDFKHFKNILIDECHDVDSQKTKSFKDGMYKKLVKALKPDKLIGFTGTPFRNKQNFDPVARKGSTTTHFLHKDTNNPIFKKCLYSYDLQQAFKDKFITPIKYFITDYYSYYLREGGVDFTINDVVKDNQRNNVLHKIITQCKQFKQENDNKSALIFVASIDEAMFVAMELKKLNITAKVVEGKTPSKQRASFIEGFKNGSIQYIVNVATMTTGFDFPALARVMLGRATNSLALYQQMLGRGIRLHPSKEYCECYDYCGSLARLGKLENIEYRGITTDSPSLICGNKVLIAPPTLFETKIYQIVKNDFNVNAVITTLLQNNQVSQEDKILIATKHKSGKFIGEYIASRDDRYIQNLLSADKKYLQDFGNKIIKIKQRLNILYSSHF